jgi:integrase
MTCWPDLVRAYLRARRQTIEAATSAVNYRYVLSVLARHLDAAEVDPHADIAVLAAAVADWTGARRWAPSTRCTNLGIVRPFLDWGARRGLITPGVAAELGNPRRPDPIPRALSTAQVAQLLTHVPDRRGRVIVLLEFQCGLRRAEVARLDLADLDLAAGSALVHGKGRVQRIAYLSADTIDAVRVWLVERGPGPGALVCAYDHPGRRLTPTWVGMMVSQWMADAGLKTAPGDGVSGHALRHSCATTMLRNGQNIRVVQRAMGHRSIQTTARYLRADDDEVREAMSGVSTGTRRLAAVEDAG